MIVLGQHSFGSIWIFWREPGDKTYYPFEAEEEILSENQMRVICAFSLNETYHKNMPHNWQPV